MTENNGLLIFFIILILVIAFIELFFYTPRIIADNLYGIKFGPIKFIYSNQNKELITFSFDHKYYDGSLMAYSIKHSLVKPEAFNVDKNTQIYDFEPYQYLPNNKISQCSKFASSVSYLLNEMMKHQKRDINVCIIVSIRNTNKNKEFNTKKGNYIKFANYTITQLDTILDICSKHSNAVKNTQLKKYTNTNTTIHDLVSSFNVDYVFDSWRDLSSINTKNNGLLTRKSTKKILKKDIDNLIQFKQRSFIILDFDDNKYVISAINHF